MAKRVRGNRSAHRPGGQGPGRSSKPVDDPVSATPGVPTPDIDEAVEIVSAEYTEIALEAPEPAATRGTTKPRRTRRSARAQAESLEGRAAAENIYVRADLRRIAVVSAILLAALAVAWVLFGALDILDLY